MRAFFSRQFLAFLCTGGIAAAVNFGSRIVYNQWIGFSSAVLVAYITGMITAFVLARAFVFTGSTQTIHRSIGFFILVNVLAVFQTWIISISFAYYVLPIMGVEHYVKDVAHAVGILVPVFSSYIGHKHWSFKS
ncbi:MAG TPA: GtrA family protein [Eoetvoesiella sp.]|uniref:GtrA family protein n=1 Tax=Eoetvoesiella sp. TaxID=1966355 RepID=UPI002CEC73BA|nr:GtrA family protein [Eoetvoesiella sp.]HWK61404.1 GtrA family protein [Eoetvoesiella sp.]